MTPLIIYIPKISKQYTGLWAAKESILRHHKAEPAPKPWIRTIGILVDSSLDRTVHILFSSFPTVLPMLTKNPLYEAFKSEKKYSLICKW